jgi:hypothetical protein
MKRIIQENPAVAWFDSQTARDCSMSQVAQTQAIPVVWKRAICGRASMSPLRYSVAMPSQYVRLRQISLAGLFVLSLLPRGASPESQSAVMPDVPTVLRINAREVILDVVARDKNNNPVTDLSENEFQVFEAVKHGDSIPRRVLSMRVIDPRKDAMPSPAAFASAPAPSAPSTPQPTTSSPFRHPMSPAFIRSSSKARVLT